VIANNMTDDIIGSVPGIAPIFVSGVYRSGTTFLAALLGAHPDFEATSSTVKFLRFNLGRYGDLREHDNLRNLLCDTQRRLQTRWNLNLDGDLVLRDLLGAEDVTYAHCYDAIMRALLLEGAPPQARWVEKLAMQWSDIPLFLQMFPDAHVIHIIRDPRDVMASYKAMTFETGFAYLDAAFNCRHAMDSVEKYRECLPPERFLAIRAEDIGSDVKASVDRICEFLGVNPSPSMLNDKELSARGEDWRTNTSFEGEFSAFPMPTPRWPEHLSRAETIFAELITQPQFSRWGYSAAPGTLTVDDMIDVARFLEDPFIARRFTNWINNGEGSEGYKSDPYEHEMRIVFPERFQSEAQQ
jgi:hypothetical protein